MHINLTLLLDEDDAQAFEHCQNIYLLPDAGWKFT